MGRRSGREFAGFDLSPRPGRLVATRAAAAYGALRLAMRLGGWAAIRHRPHAQSVAARLAALPVRGLPLEAPVDIRWNDHLVPYIEARSDRDLATALGLVHAHLRLAQLEMLRRVAQGRLAEAVGAVAVPLDHTLRAIDLGRAVPAILAAMPDERRAWLEAFVAGINHHLQAGAGPPELRLLGIAPAPWRVEDVLAVGRLCSADVNWLIWLRLLRLRRGEDWSEIWGRLIADGAAPIPTLAAGSAEPAELFARIMLGTGRSGSNAVAVSGRRSATGQPWLAGDPHLGLSLPNVWLAAAYRSPSFNVAGLMIPGIPAMAVGRNPSLAWGGTNLHAASSELFDVSGLPPAEIAERRVRIEVRWSRPREVVLRETAYGPIISDAPLFASRDGRALALRWVGHEPSDEIGALLAINQARDAAAFRRAAEAIAVPGQTLVVADSAGRIGRFPAARLPRRAPVPPADLVSPLAAAAAWTQRAAPEDFRAEIDPARGFVVSANDRPEPGEVLVGWFFSPNDRAERLTALLRACERVGAAELGELLSDVAAPASLELRDRLIAERGPPPHDCPVFAALAAWDGRYEANSAGALAFELAVARLIAAEIPAGRRAAFGVAWHGRRLLVAEIERLPPERLAAALRAAVAACRPTFRRLRDWGGAHRLRLAHPLAALPALGRRYGFIDWPWPGASDTVFKSSHGLVTGRHHAGYGSNARYMFDLSDPDANRLVILGGQDGMPGSAAFLDQAELFRRGEYIEVPLSPEGARARFAHSTLLEP